MNWKKFNEMQKNWMKGKTFLMKLKNFNEMQEFEWREKPF
jgi:hypothetical protein